MENNRITRVIAKQIEKKNPDEVEIILLLITIVVDC